MLFINKYLVPRGYTGITIFPFIFLKEEKELANLALINHEKIHLQQQKELLVIIFYIWYLTEFIFLYLRHQNWHTAYQNISFEKEAYAYECDLLYLKKRPKWAFLKFI